MTESSQADTPQRRHPVTLVPGAWIGPETCDVVREVIEASGVHIDWDVFENADKITPELVESCRRTKVVLKAKMDSPQAGAQSPTMVLRRELGTWATVRHVTALSGVKARFPDIDLVIIRETSEGIYTGLEHEVSKGVYEAVKLTTQAACERIARFTFDYARAHGRKKVTIVHKANIMKLTDGLFMRTAYEIAKEYPEIETEDAIVDALCMRLVRWPNQFDVLLCGNLFGDIVSDLCAGLAGGITAGASASHGENIHLFENPHGKAPDIVGQDRANPIPMMMTASLMLDQLGEEKAANRIRTAVTTILQEGLSTIDQGGDARCSQVRDAVIAKL